MLSPSWSIFIVGSIKYRFSQNCAREYNCPEELKFLIYLKRINKLCFTKLKYILNKIVRYVRWNIIAPIMVIVIELQSP